MNSDIRQLLEAVRAGDTSVDDALLEIKKAPFEDIGYAKVDLHRKIRQGAAEVIYGAGKTPEQIAGIIDTIINALSSLLVTLPSALLACGMFVVQTLFNLAVPSGSGQAAITMPIMAPLADMVGITRQTAVLAFQLGSTFTDIIGPTSGEALIAIAMCKVSYPKWVKWLLPMFCLWCIVAFAFLIFATMTAYGPF